MSISGLLVASLVLNAGAIAPSGDAETTKWGKKDTGHVVTDAGVTYEVEGPMNLLLELRGDDAVKGKKVKVEILRDDSFRSENEVAFRKKGGGPKGMKQLAKLGYAVPEGKHTVVIKTDGTKLALLATKAKKVPKKIAAAAEVEVEKPAVVAAAEEPAPMPPETPVEMPPETPSEGTTEIAAATVDTMNETAALATMAEGSSGGDMPRLETALRVAVYDFELQGIEPTVGKVVSDAMVAEVRKLQGVSAIGMVEIRDMLSHEASKQLLGCESDESCLAEIAGALGVDNLITGSLSKVGDGHVLVARRIDQNRAQVVGTINKRLKAGAGQEFLLAIGPAVEELFPDRGIKEGMERGVPREVALRIDPPPLPPWTTYAVGGGALAAVIAGGVYGLLSRESESEYRSLVCQASPDGTDGCPPNSSQTVVSGAKLVGISDKAESRANIANAAFITAGTLAISAAVMAFFTDWWGYGEESDR